LIDYPPFNLQRPQGRIPPSETEGGEIRSSRKKANSRLRQLWQISNALFKVRKSVPTQKDVKNGDRSSEFTENKGAKKVLLGVY
jgi:hypothetical protein